MANTIPSQYQSTPPAGLPANLSPLQLAAAYYMDQGQQTPFFVNHDFLEQFKIFLDSGPTMPEELGVEGINVEVDDDKVFVNRRASDCGPDETDRYEKVYVGTVDAIGPRSWTFGSATIRGGSAARGAGGPWGTGGLTSQDPTPNNSVNREPDIVTNVYKTYGANASTSTNSVA